MKNTLAKRALSVFAAGMLSLGLALGLASCGPAGPSDEELIKTSIDELIATFKNPTEENLAEYIGDTDMSEFEQYGIDIYEFFRNMFKRLDYTIDDVQVEGDTATVTMTVTNADLAAAMEAASDTVGNNPEAYMEGVDTTDADAVMKALMSALFNEMYTVLDATDDLVTSEITINLTKTDGVWDIDESSVNDFVSAMYGGMDI